MSDDSKVENIVLRELLLDWFNIEDEIKKIYVKNILDAIKEVDKLNLEDYLKTRDALKKVIEYYSTKDERKSFGLVW